MICEHKYEQHLSIQTCNLLQSPVCQNCQSMHNNWLNHEQDWWWINQLLFSTKDHKISLCFCFRGFSFAQNPKLAPVPTPSSYISDRKWLASTSNATTLNTFCNTDIKTLGSCTCTFQNVTLLIQCTRCLMEAKQPLEYWSSLKRCLQRTEISICQSGTPLRK